jgi:hypothetical protein
MRAARGKVSFAYPDGLGHRIAAAYHANVREAENSVHDCRPKDTPPSDFDWTTAAELANKYEREEKHCTTNAVEIENDWINVGFAYAGDLDKKLCRSVKQDRGYQPNPRERAPQVPRVRWRWRGGDVKD